MKLLVVLGTRPEAIKLAPLILEARKRADIELRVASTGQHRELLAPILAWFGIVPDYDLGLMEPRQPLERLTARALEGIAAVINGERPDAVIVQGDTTTAMAGALAAFYNGVPVAHIEAGLRTGRIDAPWPEEFNRRAVALVARWHFAPTRRAADALMAEGLPSNGETAPRIFVSGNTVIDALAWTIKQPADASTMSEAWNRATVWLAESGQRRLVLVTGHRRESFGEPFRNICGAIRDLADAQPEWLFVYPVHRNPNVVGPVEELLSNHARIVLAPPMDYPAFTNLLACSDLVITDSGGVQEEAPALGVPVVVTRETTERPEAVESGAAVLAGSDRAKIARCALDSISPVRLPRAGSICANPYGDGRAAVRCLDVLAGRDVPEFGARQ